MRQWGKLKEKRGKGREHSSTKIRLQTKQAQQRPKSWSVDEDAVIKKPAKPAFDLAMIPGEEKAGKACPSRKRQQQAEEGLGAGTKHTPAGRKMFQMGKKEKKEGNCFEGTSAERPRLPGNITARTQPAPFAS